MAQHSTSERISGAVGELPSPNKPDDVLLVQQLLIIAGAKIAADKQCGPRTVQAIKDYQRNFLSQPDGRVDPGGLTWRHLIEKKLKLKPEALFVLLQNGKGYYSYSELRKQYGTPKCLQALQRICAQFSTKFADLKVGIGDISLQAGGELLPHRTHKQGLNVDVRPLRKDKKNLPVSITDLNYSLPFTKVLVECILADANTKAILFNDTQIKGVGSWPGHDNHLHITMKE